MRYIKIRGNPDCKVCDVDIKAPYDSPIVRLIFPSFPHIPQLMCVECGYHSYLEVSGDDTAGPPTRPVRTEEKEHEV